MTLGFQQWWRRLADADQSKAGYLGRALLADLPVTLVIGLLLNWVTGTTWPTFEGISLTRVMVAMCLFAPVVETLLMGLVIVLLQRVVKRPRWVPWISALIWATLHSLADPTWGFGIFWSFVIFSLCFVTWKRKSLLQAFLMTAILHALHNLFPALLLIGSRMMAAGSP